MLERETVDRVAALARLGLTDDEAERYRVELATILEYVDQLTAAQGVAQSTARAGARWLTLREDVAEPSLARDAVMANAPDFVAGFFRTPPVLE